MRIVDHGYINVIVFVCFTAS